MAYSESRSNNLRKKSGVDEALVGHATWPLKELGKMMAQDPKLTRKVADLAGMVLKKRIDKDGKWNGNYKSMVWQRQKRWCWRRRLGPLQYQR